MAKLTNWEKFDNAFNLVSAYVVLDQDTMQPIAKIALKYPKDGAGRLHAYIHVIGMDVQHSYAGGYGYDKRTAAIINASKHCLSVIESKPTNTSTKQLEFINLLLSDKAQGGWQEVINPKNNFIVIQAV